MTLYCPGDALPDDEAIALAAKLQAQFNGQGGQWSWLWGRRSSADTYGALFADQGSCARHFLGSREGFRALDDLRDRQLMDEWEAEMKPINE